MQTKTQRIISLCSAIGIAVISVLCGSSESLWAIIVACVLASTSVLLGHIESGKLNARIVELEQCRIIGGDDVEDNDADTDEKPSNALLCVQVVLCIVASLVLLCSRLCS